MTQLLKQSGPYLFGGGLITFLMLFDLRHIVSYSDTYILYGVSVTFSLLAFALAMHSFYGFKTAFDGKIKLMHCCAIAAFTVFFSYYASKAYGVIQPVKPAFTQGYITWVLDILFIFAAPLLTLLIVVVCELSIVFKTNKPIEKNPYGNASLLSSSEAEHKSAKNGLPLGRILKGLEGNETNLSDKIKSASAGSIFRYNPVHSFLIAPTGAGKGVGFVIPTLLDYDGPIVCVDPKGAENYKITAKHRSKSGKKVYAFDTNDVKSSAKINIFDFLDINHDKFIDHLKSFVASLCPVTGHKRDDFWIETAQDILACLMITIASDTDRRGSLRDVYDLLMETNEAFKAILEAIAAGEDNAHESAIRIAKKILSKDPRELSGYMSTAQNALRFLDSPSFGSLVSETSFDIEDIFSNKADLFLCISNEEMESGGNSFIRMVIAIISQQLKQRVSPPEKNVMFLLDEMGVIGRVREVKDMLLLGRSYGMRLVGVSQSLESLKEIYPGEFKTILSSSLVMFLGSRELSDLKYTAERLGYTTVFSESESKTKRSSSQHEGQTTSAIKREILTPDDISRLSKDHVIVFAEGLQPAVLRRINYLEDKSYKGKYGNNPFH